MDENEMVPRIVVTDRRDAELIAGALCLRLHQVWAKVTITGDIDTALEISRRMTTLLTELVDASRAGEARNVFGPMLSDEDLAEQVEKMREDLGES